jgi:hypothetical protein
VIEISEEHTASIFWEEHMLRKQSARRLVAGFSPRRSGLKPMSSHVRFVVDKVALGRFLPSTSVSPANIHSTNFSTITLTYHPVLVQ